MSLRRSVNYAIATCAIASLFLFAIQIGYDFGFLKDPVWSLPSFLILFLALPWISFLDWNNYTDGQQNLTAALLIGMNIGILHFVGSMLFRNRKRDA